MALYETDHSMVKVDPKSGEETLIHDFSDPAFFEDAALILGDAIHNRAGSANSDRGLSGGSVRRQPKMAEMRRADEQTSASEPHSDLQGEGGLGRYQGRKDAIGVGGAV